MNTTVSLHTKRIVWTLGVIMLLLIAASLIGQIYIRTGGHERYLVTAFSLDDEHNVPTWFSALLLLVSAQLAVWIALIERAGRRRYGAWLGMAAVLLYLAMDEVLQFHEQWNGVFMGVIDPSYFPWLWFYGVVLVLLAVVFTPFLWRLPRRTAGLFFAAGAVYVAGAAGLELVDVSHRAVHGKDMTYVLLQTLEEALEMAGVVLLVYALLDFIRGYGAIAMQVR